MKVQAITNYKLNPSYRNCDQNQDIVKFEFCGNHEYIFYWISDDEYVEVLQTD